MQRIIWWCFKTLRFTSSLLLFHQIKTKSHYSKHGAQSKQKSVAQRNRSGLKSKSSNKPESSTGKSGSNSQSAAHASKSVKQRKYTPEAVDQLRLNYRSPDLCFQDLLAIGSTENPKDFLEYLSGKELTCLLKALDKPCHDKKSKEKQIAELLSALNKKPRHFSLPEHLSAIYHSKKVK